MAIYEFDTPQGIKKIEVGEGIGPEQAYSILQEHLSTSTSEPTPTPSPTPTLDDLRPETQPTQQGMGSTAIKDLIKMSLGPLAGQVEMPQKMIEGAGYGDLGKSVSGMFDAPVQAYNKASTFSLSDYPAAAGKYVGGLATGEGRSFQNALESIRKQQAQTAQENPKLSAIGTILGTLSPVGGTAMIANKLGGMLKIPQTMEAIQEAKVLPLMAKMGAQGAGLGGISSIIQNIGNLGSPEVQKEILYNTIGGGLANSILGTAATKALPYVEPAGREIKKYAGKIKELVTGVGSPQKAGTEIQTAIQGKYGPGGETAKEFESIANEYLTKDKVSTNNTRQAIANTMQKIGIMNKTGGLIGDAVPKGKYSSEEANLLGKIWEKFTKGTDKNLKGLQDFKQYIANEISAWEAGANRKFSDPLLKKIYGSINQDIIQGVEKVHGPIGGIRVKQAMEGYAKGKEALDFYKQPGAFGKTLKTENQNEVAQKLISNKDNPSFIKRVIKDTSKPLVKNTVLSDTFEKTISPTGSMDLNKIHTELNKIGDESLKLMLTKSEYETVSQFKEQLVGALRSGRSSIQLPQTIGTNVEGIIRKGPIELIKNISANVLGPVAYRATQLGGQLGLKGSTAITNVMRDYNKYESMKEKR